MTTTIKDDTTGLHYVGRNFNTNSNISNNNIMKDEITLLNGERWNIKRLITKMIDDNFYYGYCSRSMLSSSAIKLLHTSIKKFYFINQAQSNNNQALRDGWLFHTSILEPHKFEEVIFSETLTKGVAFKKLVEMHGQGNVFTLDEKQKAERLADAFYKNHKATSYLTKAQFEQPVAGIVDGYPFRGKADILRDGEIIDLKTCRDIRFFKQDAYNNGYDIQCYLYSNLFNIDYRNFRFIAIDKGTLDIGIFHSSENFYESGKKKTMRALEIYNDNIKNKETDTIKDFIYNYYLEDTL